jgi:hypothetical protein
MLKFEALITEGSDSCGLSMTMALTLVSTHKSSVFERQAVNRSANIYLLCTIAHVGELSSDRVVREGHREGGVGSYGASVPVHNRPYE